MKSIIRMLAVLALSSSGYCQITTGTAVLPKSDGSAGGELCWRDAEVTPKLFCIGAVTTINTTVHYKWPDRDGSATNVLTTDGLGNLTWSAGGGGGGGAPFLDTTNLVKSHLDATKLMQFDLTGFSTASTRVLTPQNQSYTLAGTNIAGTQTFFNIQNLDSSTGALYMGGTLVFRASDRTFWNMGDFNGHITESADNTWDFGTLAKRVRTITAVTITSASANSGPHTECGLDATTNGVSCIPWVSGMPQPEAFKLDPISGQFTSRALSCPLCSILGIPRVCIDSNTGTNGLLSYVNGECFTTIGGTITGNVILSSLSGSGNRCMELTSTGQVVVATSGTPCGGAITGSLPIVLTGTVASCPTCVTTNTAQTISATKQFSAPQNFTSASEIDMNGLLTFRASDRSVWNLGDFNTPITSSADNSWDIGTAAKRFRTGEFVTLNVRQVASSSTLCGLAFSGLNCQGSSSAVILRDASSNQCTYTPTGLGCTNFFGGSAGTINIGSITSGSVTSGSVTVSGLSGSTNRCLEANPAGQIVIALTASPCGAGGGGTLITTGSTTNLSSGQRTVATGLSSIQAFTAIAVTGGATCGIFSASGCEILTTSGYSGGSVTVYSSNTTSSAFFAWIAIGH